MDSRDRQTYLVAWNGTAGLFLERKTSNGESNEVRATLQDKNDGISLNMRHADSSVAIVANSERAQSQFKFGSGDFESFENFAAIGVHKTDEMDAPWATALFQTKIGKSRTIVTSSDIKLLKDDRTLVSMSLNKRSGSISLYDEVGDDVRIRMGLASDTGAPHIILQFGDGVNAIMADKYKR
jgi:hypothetical protein